MNAKVPLFNSDSKDFTVTYDINENKNPVEFTIHAGEIEYFEPAIADHIVKHLADKIASDRYTNPTQGMIDEIKKEIRVEL